MVGGVLGGGSNMREVVGVVVGRGNRWLMACAREDNCDKMVDRLMGLAGGGAGGTPLIGGEVGAS